MLTAAGLAREVAEAVEGALRDVGVGARAL